MNAIFSRLSSRHSLWLLTSALWVMLAPAQAAAPAAAIEAGTFRCITQMTPVRGFYVDNLLGDLQGTLKVARSTTGGVYPPGSVVQLIPTEVMVKQPAGTNPATKDWEFFELDISDKGVATFRGRGFTNVVNRFGGNCLGCHVAARPEWDMICEQGHGCAPVPLTRAMIEALQRSDARCSPPNVLRPQDIEALKLLAPPPQAPAAR
ncbi:MAG: hypothetical protein RL030_953 [Pseudomonadota bacterium]|jgi:hypothetical protein